MKTWMGYKEGRRFRRKWDGAIYKIVTIEGKWYLWRDRKSTLVPSRRLGADSRRIWKEEFEVIGE